MADQDVLDRVEDPVFTQGRHFPLGRVLGVVEMNGETPSGPDVRPFGLRFAQCAASVVVVDTEALRYDAVQQVSVDVWGLPVCAGKHSTGKTKVKTSDGHKKMDENEDYTED